MVWSGSVIHALILVNRQGLTRFERCEVCFGIVLRIAIQLIAPLFHLSLACNVLSPVGRQTSEPPGVATSPGIVVLTGADLDETDSTAEYDARFTPQRPAFLHPSLDTPPPTDPDSDSDSDSAPESDPDSCRPVGRSPSVPRFGPAGPPSPLQPVHPHSGGYPPQPPSGGSTESEYTGSDSGGSTVVIPPARPPPARPSHADPVYQNVGEVRRPVSPGARGVQSAVSMDQFPRSYSVFAGSPGPDEMFLLGRARSQPLLEPLETAI